MDSIFIEKREMNVKLVIFLEKKNIWEKDATKGHAFEEEFFFFFIRKLTQIESSSFGYMLLLFAKLFTGCAYL